MMKFADNVQNFLVRASAAVGRSEDDNFNQNIWGMCTGLKIDSPIEQILYIAMKAMSRMNYLQEGEPILCADGEWRSIGLSIVSQHEVDKYRADFLVGYAHFIESSRYVDSVVLVECDSQQFHERDERERRYEKQRDRYLTARGYRVLHFTGSEIVQDPWKVSAEILSSVIPFESADDLIGGVENYLD